MTGAIVGVVLAFLLAGCGATPFYAGMSPEQLHELVRIKDSTVNCVRALYAGAAIAIVYVNADKGIAANIAVDGECKTTLTATDPPKAPRGGP